MLRSRRSFKGRSMTSSFGQTLEALTSDDLALALCSVGTIEPLYLLLRRRREVKELRQAVETGSVTEQEIAAFVDRLLTKFKRNKKFSGDAPFAAIAVALESMQTKFARDYVEKLAALNARELPLSRKVAQLTVKRRAERLGGLTIKSAVIATPVFPQSLTLVQPRRVLSTVD